MAYHHVEEIWCVLEGEGEVWRKNAAAEDVARVSAGTCLTIPSRTAIQFRNTGTGPPCILIVTMPPWSGPREAEKAVRVWPAAVAEGAGPTTNEPGGGTRANTTVFSTPPPPEPEQWVIVDDATNTHEHASWVAAEALEQWLGRDLRTDVVRSSELRSKSPAEQVRRFLTASARFVGVVGDDQRFEYLVRRDVLVEQATRASALDAAGRTQASTAG